MKLTEAAAGIGARVVKALTKALTHVALSCGLVHVGGLTT